MVKGAIKRISYFLEEGIATVEVDVKIVAAEELQALRELERQAAIDGDSVWPGVELSPLKD